MFRTVLWVIGNLPVMLGLVTAAVGIVEAIGHRNKEGGAEKKRQAIQRLRENLTATLVLPDFLERHLDALLAILIDGVVSILNITRGNDWGAKIDEQVDAAVETVIAAQAGQAQAAPTASTQSANDARLDELEQRLTRG